ncbi:MAG: hypothetical protein WAR24_17560 [Candidatus Acidiferrales bacterium]
MAIHTIDESQRKAARVVGITYLVAAAFANFAEIYVPSKLIVYGNAAETAVISWRLNDYFVSAPPAIYLPS